MSFFVTQSNERRQSARVDISLRIEALDGGPDLLAHDLSVGGMMVSTERPRWPGQHIPVRLVLPDETRAMRLTCRVVEIVPAPERKGVGLSLKFLALNPRTRLALVRFVSRNMRRERHAGDALPA